MNKDFDYYDIRFDSEKYCMAKLKTMVKLSDCVFQLLVMDDDDEAYIPDLDFEYDVCDCSSINLLDKKIWDEFLKNERPTIFINTSFLFEQFKNYNFLGHVFKDGRQGFSQMFYSIYRDSMWNNSHAKYIFLVSEENAYAMYSSVNPGFNILLVPIYMRTDSNAQSDEKGFVKTFKKHDFSDMDL